MATTVMDSNTAIVIMLTLYLLWHVADLVYKYKKDKLDAMDQR